ncbi:tRNA 2-thiocytidine biosynthesis protein TtcA [Fervidicola ferrireducens]|uniref:tRNA 2-thiocytidine biosynthesis protein TtcA n=1 Tax=Fervidicola ferrireducens TaxID=520764 RepID=A0A140L7U3_9FIRM|nr:ATP-binding protein [Fervidicola ferrireducens]KXG76618.1 tRNA 2-thiocytidine biosynthesis protein TtcA [Fervidicola ferrireducens]
MRCRRCGEKAEIYLKRHNTAFCSSCFQVYYSEQVKRNIKREKMFKPNDRILVVVSGGKDSMALWHILLKLGYNVTGMYINLGICGYSDRSQEVVERYSQANNAPVIIKNIEKEYGFSIPALAREIRRSTCSLCGTIKRYLFNKVALDGGFDAVATGHNLDDEAATLLGNVLSWQEGYLARQSPVLPSTHPKLVKKVKPLYTLTERENLAYVLFNGIEFIHEECPHALGASSILYKEILNKLEDESPGTKQRFLTNFYKKGKKFFEKYSEPVKLNECKICGQVTTAEICSFCRLRQMAEKKKVDSMPQEGEDF